MRAGKALAATVIAAGSIAGLLALTPLPIADADRSAAPDLSRFTSQQLTWKACDVEEIDKAGAQCADVTVPLDYSDPGGRTMTVAISRYPSPDPGKRHGIMLSNPGGPGGAGLDFPLTFGAAMTPDVRAQYDLIGMDPRGIGRSAPINCEWPEGFGLQSAGVDAASYAESVTRQADLALRCANTEGDRLRHISTRNTARDMDLIRAVLGEQRISFFGTSYGTYLGSVYTQMFPERSDRIVLDSAVDPARYGAVQMVQDMGPANEAVFGSWADWTAARDSEYHFGTTRDQVRDSILGLVRRAAEQPIVIEGLAVDDHWVPMIMFTGIDDPRNYGPVAANMRTLADAAEGKAVQPDPQLVKDLKFILRSEPADNSGQFAVMCGDRAVERDPTWYWRNIEAARAAQPVFGAFANNITPCAFWAPPLEDATVVDNSVPTLIVQSTGDTRTTYANAEGMHRALSASRLVTLENVAIHYIFGRYPNTCTYAAVNDYLRTGVLPAADMTCQAD
ncbi:alpha/beta fold hydrolase [Nocardia acididurans]|uniref:alpha/beta fold hydrolase n=1 Tax=Nocardia acididurans TaxID=2802282 RepID=UPI0027DB45C1|nr:alpha/beta fold hydrolase [Nocardia acididurans]